MFCALVLALSGAGAGKPIDVDIDDLAVPDGLRSRRPARRF